MTSDTACTIIGTVSSPLTSIAEAPKQGGPDCPVAEVHVDPAYAPALHLLEPGRDIEILTWLDRADRSVLQCHPRGDVSRPLHGVFATRSPDRPNPIGLHRVRLLEMNGTRLTVHPLEAVDGTPVVDIKPALDQGDRSWGEHVPHDVGDALRSVGRDAWTRNLVSGFNGNLSMRRTNRMFITRSGSAKGHLQPGDILCMDLGSGEVCGSGRASSESPVHMAVYGEQPGARAVVHTHPPHLLALSLTANRDLLDLPLFETGLFRDRLVRVDDFRPGSQELAQSVGRASRRYDAVFMDRHGLVCWAETPVEALALTEELDNLARIRLLAGK